MKYKKSLKRFFILFLSSLFLLTITANATKYQIKPKNGGEIRVLYCSDSLIEKEIRELYEIDHNEPCSLKIPRMFIKQDERLGEGKTTRGYCLKNFFQHVVNKKDYLDTIDKEIDFQFNNAISLIEDLKNKKVESAKDFILFKDEDKEFKEIYIYNFIVPSCKVGDKDIFVLKGPCYYNKWACYLKTLLDEIGSFGNELGYTKDMYEEYAKYLINKMDEYSKTITKKYNEDIAPRLSNLNNIYGV